jgi:hypothetical protein
LDAINVSLDINLLIASELLYANNMIYLELAYCVILTLYLLEISVSLITRQFLAYTSAVKESVIYVLPIILSMMANAMSPFLTAMFIHKRAVVRPVSQDTQEMVLNALFAVA